MSQVTDYTIPGSPLTMVALATALENIFAAIGSANRGSDPPSNPFEGMLWWDSSGSPTEYLKRYTVTSGWLSLISVNTTTGTVAFVGADYVLKSILTTTGDVFYASAASTPARLAIGAEGDSLMVGADGLPYWNNIGDPLTYKGTIDCSANPNYPAADEGDMYFVSAAGKIGGASGTDVYVGYRIICKDDDTASGTEAEVGANWDVVGVTTLSGITLISLAEGFTVTGGTIPHTITVDETKALSDKADKVSNLSDMADAATAFANIKQAATTSATGVSEQATEAETIAGEDDERYVTPKGVRVVTLAESDMLKQQFYM